MSDGATIFATPKPAGAAGQRLERAVGAVRLLAEDDGGKTRLVEGYQAGSARLRFPRRRPHAPLEAVLINTAGGLTGGDHMCVSTRADDASHLLVTTQAAERIYRRAADSAKVETNLAVGAGATLDWLPQETIVFDGAALTRRLEVDVAATGRLLAVEAIVLGRAAMGERARNATISDTWRIKRAGRLIFADGLRLDGDADATLARGATGGGARALATLVFVAPEAESRLDITRELLATCASEAGASAWNGMLVARLLATKGQALRADLVGLIESLRGGPMPRVWQC